MIEFLELYYCSGCALDKICETHIFDRCSHEWSSQNHFWLVVMQKERIGEQLIKTIFETSVLTLFRGFFFESEIHSFDSCPHGWSSQKCYDSFPRKRPRCITSSISCFPENVTH